jgi:hypothetical protein
MRYSEIRNRTDVKQQLALRQWVRVNAGDVSASTWWRDEFEEHCEEARAWKQSLRVKNTAFQDEEDWAVDTLYRRPFHTLGPKGSENSAAASVPTVAVEPAVVAPTEPVIIDPATVSNDPVPNAAPAGTQPQLEIPVVLPTDIVAATPRNSGYAGEPALSNELSGEPVDELEPSGWMAWEDGDLGGEAVYHAGSIVRSSYKHEWQVNLQSGFNDSFPIGSTVEMQIRSLVNSLTPVFTIKSMWGYGNPSPEVEILKAGFYDEYTVTQMTHISKTMLIPVARETIGYNVPFGLSVYNRTMPYNSVSSITPTSDLYAQIRERKVADAFNRMILTTAQQGNNHLALGATMYMRLVAVRIAAEQGATPYVEIEAAGYNKFLASVGTSEDVLVETARTYAEKTPLNVVTMPNNAIENEEHYMYYLAGNGRARISWQKEVGSEVKELYSCIDAYVPEQRFILTPIKNRRRLQPMSPNEKLRLHMDTYLLETIVAKYLTTHNLWQEFPLMRAFAWCLLAHPASAVNLKFPAPMHAAELQLNLWPNTTASHVNRVLGDVDNYTSLHATVVCSARCAEEVMTDAIVSTTAAVGVPFNHPAYRATVEQELGRHLYNGYAHMIQPVLEKLLRDKFPELTQFLSDSVLALQQCTAGRDLDKKLFKATSYLALGEVPEGEGWQVVFHESTRRNVASARRMTSRQALVINWLTEKSLEVKPSTVTYLQHESEPLDDSLVVPTWVGQPGKTKLNNLQGAPQLWDYWTSGVLGMVPRRKQALPHTSSFGGDRIAAAFAKLVARAEAHLEEVGKAKSDGEEDEEDIFEPDDAGSIKEDVDPDDIIYDQGEPTGAEPVMSGGNGSGPAEADEGDKKPPTTDDKPDEPQSVERGFQPVQKKCRVITRNTMVMANAGLYGAKIPSGKKSSCSKSTAIRKKKTKKHTTAEPEVGTDDESWYKPNRARGAIGDDGPQSKERHLSLLTKWKLSKEEVKELDAYYPRGADAALKRAPYTAANLWNKRRVLCRDSARIQDMEVAYANAAYGKNAWLVTLGLYIISHTLSDGAWKLLKEQGILVTSYEHWNSKWASFNDIIRNQWAEGTFPHTNEDLPQMLYLANMVGRPHREVDWDDEVQKRTRVLSEIKVPSAQGMRELTIGELETEIMATLLAEGTLKVKKVQTFEQFYKARANWMIKGSASGERTVIAEYHDVLKELKELGVAIRPRAAKTDVAEYVTYQEILDVLDDIAVHLAKAHTKGNEHGKLRAIYGSLYTHYVLGSFWSLYLEDTVQLRSASMNKDNSVLLEESMARSTSCKNGRWIVCLDYADFNAQHTGAAQECVLNTIYKWACLKGFTPTGEFSKIHEWYSSSFRNQWFQRPDNHKWVKALSGMFSGVRQTTLFNTVLNLTYHRIALKTCYEMGSMVRCPAAYVLGDDGWVEFYTEEEARQYLAAAKLGGMEINALKQLLSKGRGEYLRLIYDKDGKVRGCPVRSLASFVHGNVETNTASMGQQRIAEMYSQACMLTRRGLDRSTWQNIFEDLAVYEIGYIGQVSRGQCLTYLYGTKQTGALGLMPIYRTKYIGKIPSETVEEEATTISAADQLAALMLKEKLANHFKASKDFATLMEEEYDVVWKYEGKKHATALIAAQNLTDGSQKKESAHEQLLAKVLLAKIDRQEWARAMDWDFNIGGPSIGPTNIEKQYRKQRLAEERIISLVTKISSVAHYITDESKTRVIRAISAKLDVPLAAVKAAFKSSGAMKETMVDYIPKPDMVPEMEGIYTQWLVINKDTNRTTAIPRWIRQYSSELQY